MYIHLLMFPLQMPSPYLIFAKKAEDNIDLPENCSPWSNYVLRVNGPLFLGMSDTTGFCQVGHSDFFFFCFGSFIGSPVSLLLRFYCIFHDSIHFTLEWSSHPSANHGPSCLTSVILWVLVFLAWYCRSWNLFLYCLGHFNVVGTGSITPPPP